MEPTDRRAPGPEVRRPELPTRDPCRRFSDMRSTTTRISQPFNRLRFPVVLVATAFPVAVLPAQATWEMLKVETTASFRGLSVVDDRVVWASGTRGTVIHTSDGGKTWSVDSVPGAGTMDLRGVHGRSANVAHVAATSGPDLADDGRRPLLVAAVPGDRHHDVPRRHHLRGRSHRFCVRRSDGEPLRHPRHARRWRDVERSAGSVAPGSCRWRSGVRRQRHVAGVRECATWLARYWRLGRACLSHRRRRRELDRRAIRNSPTFRDRRRVFGRVRRCASRRRCGRRLPESRFVDWDGRAHQSTAARPGNPHPAFRAAIAPASPCGGSARTVSIAIAVGTTGSDMSRDGGRTWMPLDGTAFNAVQFAPSGTAFAVGGRGRVARLLVR